MTIGYMREDMGEAGRIFDARGTGGEGEEGDEGDEGNKRRGGCIGGRVGSGEMGGDENDIFFFPRGV